MTTIYQLPTQLVGSVGIYPTPKYMKCGDSLATVTTAGYLNSVNLESNPLTTEDILQILYAYNPVTKVGTYGLFTVGISNGVITLSQASFAGEVTLPTIANNIIVSTNTNGGLANLTGTAINAGSLQAGLSGTAGTLISYPATSAKGSLIVAGVANTGNTNTTISNAAMGQASVISIPDPGVASTSFLLADNVSGQTINTGNFTVTAGNIIATAGNLVAGSSGNAGTVTSFPGTAAEGKLVLAAVNNATGNFNTTISNAAAIAQSQVISIPDSGTTAANFILSASGGTQTIATGSLALTVGSFTTIAGNITAGSSGNAGTLTSFPTTSAKGSFTIAGVANTGNTVTTLSNVAMGQASTINIPDPGNATGQLMIGATATPFVSGNFPKASGTAGLFVDSGISPTLGATAGIPYTAIVTMNTAAVTGAYATPVQIVAAPGASQTIMVLNAQVITEVSTAFATGGVAQLQYGSTIHGAGTIATSATIAAAEITAASSQIFTMAPIAAATVMATATFKSLGLYFSNATQAFTNGASSTITIAVTYVVIPSV